MSLIKEGYACLDGINKKSHMGIPYVKKHLSALKYIGIYYKINSIKGLLKR